MEGMGEGGGKPGETRTQDPGSRAQGGGGIGGWWWWRFGSGCNVVF